MNARRTVATGASAAALVMWSLRARRRHRHFSGVPTIAVDRSPATSTPAAALTATGRVGRIARVSRMFGRGVARKAILRARLWSADDDRRTALNEEYTLRTAADVAEQLGQMRGVMMKVGQMVSFIAETLPEPTRAALASLQESAPPMDSALAAQVITDELGTTPDRLFASWEPAPVAAASIGQVHRATTHSGDGVAVKVQYPGVGAAIEADLANTALLYHLVGQWFDSLDTEALVAEFRERISDELDYRKEATNQRAFTQMFAGHPWVRIPELFPQLSATRVLTSEWIDGLRLNDFVTAAPDEVRQRAAEVVWRFAQHSIHRHLIFNGDPHPGNFRFHHDGTVTFLDFGMVKRWLPSEWDELRVTLDAVILDRDPDRICDAMRRSGFLATDRTVDAERTAAFVCAPYEPYLVDEFVYTPEWMSDALTRSTTLGSQNADIVKALNVPASFLILNRVVWGINALMTALGAHGPFRAMLLEYVADGPPATEMGAVEAEWRAQARPGIN